MLGFGAADQTRVGLTPKRVLLTPSFQTFHILPNLGKEMETLIEIPYKDRERESKSQARNASQPINTLGVGQPRNPSNQHFQSNSP